MSVVKLAGYDIEVVFGAHITNLGAILDAAVTTQAELTLPGMEGAMLAGVWTEKTPVRGAVLEMYLDGASQAAVRTALHALQALLGGGDLVTLEIGDWSGVWISGYCTGFPALNYPLNSRGNSQNEIPIAIKIPIRFITPYWTDTTASQVVAFTSTPVAMPQGTAPSAPILTTDAAACAIDLLTCKDYLGATLWTCQLAARLITERYRITTARGVMTLEKYNGAAWVVSESSRIGGIFPKLLPSNNIGYQTSAWPTLEATHGSWTATYPRRWR
jgi:hypothetical protein